MMQIRTRLPCGVYDLAAFPFYQVQSVSHVLHLADYILNVFKTNALSERKHLFVKLQFLEAKFISDVMSFHKIKLLLLTDLDLAK